MKQETLIKIIKKIYKTDNIQINRIKNEESPSYYNVWEVELNNYKYILKKTSNNELLNYQNINNAFIPKLFGYTNYYNKVYLLIEYIDGKNLMYATKDNAIKAVDAIINLNKEYLNKEVLLSDTFEKELVRINKRLNYLNNELLIKAYNKFIDVYKNTIKTVCHNDLLPFNIMISNENAYFIDLEHMGYLPYLTMFSRFITHYKNDENYLFYLSDIDKEYLVKYYYDNFVSTLNISYESYIKDLMLFMFFEFTEWVYVYNLYNKEKDERFNYYYNQSILTAKKILL